ncbi:DUF4836 family protein, partial [Bacteroides sp. 51]|uniref:DUF4836 family protein n=1 Tax=Bacteroides sp. 51 TaxID=2302938 RepID=UPI0013CF7735
MGRKLESRWLFRVRYVLSRLPSLPVCSIIGLPDKRFFSTMDALPSMYKRQMDMTLGSMDNIDPKDIEQLTVKDLLEKSEYRIPIYQRNYT